MCLSTRTDNVFTLSVGLYKNLGLATGKPVHVLRPTITTMPVFDGSIKILEYGHAEIYFYPQYLGRPIFARRKA